MKIGVVIASIGGASAVGVAAVGGYHYLSHKENSVSIRSSLKDFKLISTLTGEALTKQWVAEFKSATNDIKEKIEELKNVTDEAEGGRKLASWCSKQMDLDSRKYPETFELVKKYCLVRDLSSQLKRNNKSVLDRKQDSDWKDVFQKRKTQKSTRSDVGIKDATWPTGNEKDDVDLLMIQTWCENTEKEEFLASDNNSKYDKLLKWCTADGKTLE
nr:hypothetical protein [Mycoplasma haemocanis]